MSTLALPHLFTFILLLVLLTKVSHASCPRLEGRLTCKGLQVDLTNYDRDVENPPRHIRRRKTQKAELCQHQCEYFGVPGCCLWQDEQEKCFFVSGGETSPSGESIKIGIFSSNLAADCTVPSCTMEMNTVQHRQQQCDWSGVDNEGQEELEGSGNTEEDCDQFCLDDADCMFSAFEITTGSCHSFRTCNGHAEGDGWVVKQKACQGATDYIPWFSWEEESLGKPPMIVFVFATIGVVCTVCSLCSRNC